MSSHIYSLSCRSKRPITRQMYRARNSLISCGSKPLPQEEAARFLALEK